MAEQTEPLFIPPSQAEVNAVPSFFVDAHLGIANAGGVARITFAALKFNAAEGAQGPIFQPVVTMQMPEQMLLIFAQEMIKRAETLGVRPYDAKDD